MRNHRKLLLESLMGRDFSEGLGADARMKLKWILGDMRFDGADWIHLAQYRDRWWAVVNTS
jgi:hypothetical protein